MRIQLTISKNKILTHNHKELDWETDPLSPVTNAGSQPASDLLLGSLLGSQIRISDHNLGSQTIAPVTFGPMWPELWPKLTTFLIPIPTPNLEPTQEN